jgi:hypothetical protein
MTSKPLLHDVYSSIIDSLNPNDLKTVVTRMKTTSKSFKNTILGDDNMDRMLSSSYFKFNGKYLITEPIILKKTKAEKVTFCGMSLYDIIDFISSEGYLLYFRNPKRRNLYMAEIKYKNGVFYFNCSNLINRKYKTHDWYAYCTCTLDFKNSKPTIKLIKTLPHISNTETLGDIINDDRNDDRSINARHQAIYYQNFPYDLYAYVLKDEEISSKPKFEFTFEKFEKDNGVLITVIFKQK